MKKSTIFFLIIVLCFGIINYTKADEPKRIAQATMSFLNIDVGARAIGMGGAFVSMDKDASALFWNPAGIAKIKGGALSLNHTQWLADTKQYAIAATLGPATLGIPLLGTFGVSFMLMDNGELERTEPVDLSVDPKGYIVGETFNVNQFAVGIAYGHEISDKFSVGGQIKYAYQDLGSADVLIQTVEKADTLQDEKNQEGTIAVDFGTIYYTGFKDLRISMSFRNFASSVKYAYESYELPLTFKVGLAMNVLSLMGPDDGIHSLEVAVDAVRPRDYTERIHLGTEYWFKDLFAVRAGYKFNYDEGGFSAGFGLNQSISGLNFKFDYAYTSFGEIFGSVQRISFGFSF